MHAIQTQRKDMDCEYTDRIEVGVVTDDAELRRAVEQFADYIRGETLAVDSCSSRCRRRSRPIELKLGAASGAAVRRRW